MFGLAGTLVTGEKRGSGDDDQLSRPGLHPDQVCLVGTGTSARSGVKATLVRV